MGEFLKFEVFFGDLAKKTHLEVPIRLDSSYRTYGRVGWSSIPSNQHGHIYCERNAFESAIAKQGSKWIAGYKEM